MALLDNYGTGGVLGMPVPDSATPGMGANTNPLYTWLKALLPAAFPQDQSAPQPTTNTARPDILAPLTGPQLPNIQGQPSQMPNTPQPQGAAGPPQQLGGFDLGTIGPGLDPGAGQNLPPNATLTQGGPPPPQFQNPYQTTGIMDRLARGLSIMDPVGGQAYYGRQIAEAQYNALMQQPGMTPGKALAIMQNPSIAQNYYDSRSLGPTKIGPIETPTVTSQGQTGLAISGGGGIGDLVNAANDVTRQQEASKAQGTAQGTALAGLSNTHALFDKGLEDIDALIKDPNLKTAVGLQGELMTRIPGTAAQGIKARLDQLHGEASLAGLQYLQKIGRLNINEFNAGAHAISRLQSAQSYNDMVGALQDLRKVFVLARTRSGETAGVGPTPPQSNAQPTYTQDQLTAEAKRRGLIP